MVPLNEPFIKRVFSEAPGKSKLKWSKMTKVK